MRFTSVLRQINYHRHFQRIWKRQGKMEVKEFKLSPELQEMGIEIIDAKDIMLETKLFNHPVKKVEGLPYPLPPSAFTQEMPYYRMHADVKVSENENQALALTKTVPYKGLPKSITSLIAVDPLPNQDELVQTSILQAQVWDAAQDKLPKIVNPDRPGYVYKRPFGILYEKKVSSLLEKLSYLCESATGRYAECFQRNKLLNAFCEIGIQRSGSNIVFQMPCDMLLEARKPLQRFSSPADVEETLNETVPNIYPIKPTLDLEKWVTNPLSEREIAIKPLSFGTLHTLFVTHKSPELWLPSQQLSRAISTCFAFAAVEAQNKFGADIKELPEPISIQCMYMDVKSVNFIAYQLNTLDLHDNEGIKNQVWIDEAADLYSNVSEVDLIADYNPSIFSKMLALHMNGLLHS